MSTTYNELMATVLSAITVQVQKLFYNDRSKVKGKYVHLDPSEDRSVPHLATDGTIIYTEYFGKINISAPDSDSMLSIYDECVSALKLYGFHISDFDDDGRRNRHKREISVKILC